ncbi:MAG: DMT family transporter [Kiloniellales bacterium]
MIHFLYLVTIAVWGTSWLAIQFQLGIVSPAASVTYRFVLSAVIMLALCWVMRRRTRFTAAQHGRAALQGLLLFSTNYYLIYEGSRFLPSGLVAVIFACVVIMNIAGTAILFGEPVGRRTLVGAGLGLAGITAVFWPEIAAFDLSREGSVGLLLCLLGTLSASLGMLTSAANQRRGMPVLETNSVGMAYGALFMALYTLAAGERFGFELSAAYVLSLVFLAVFATVIGFWSYLTLVGRIGADRAGYVTVVFPIVALLLSTWFEDFHWTPLSLAGVALVMLGNGFILIKARERKPLPAV